ncbi:hypothetical protein [Burkholderia sp. SCN-KJ]|uniref:hypothetical protein n=1 Tax=Burkholderia sp. SCN-KJ TaxID=2969248 RepID=UPI00214FD6E4|nr:hypothetical protein [Burkholderia sp. SCN-KJ]MCR4468330.1 hypothetical protein [Burkholderia sp. SCN-KJ]
MRGARVRRAGRGENLQCRIAPQIDIDRKGARDVRQYDPARLVERRRRVVGGIGGIGDGPQPPRVDAGETGGKCVDARIEQHPAGVRGVLRDARQA